MEEKKQVNQQVEQKYTYDQLNSIASNLFQENRDLKKRLEVMNEAIGDLQTQNLFAYVGMLNKILDNAIHFKPEFTEEVASDLMTIKSKIGSTIFGGNAVNGQDANDAHGEGTESDSAPEQAE